MCDHKHEDDDANRLLTKSLISALFIYLMMLGTLLFMSSDRDLRDWAATCILLQSVLLPVTVFNHAVVMLREKDQKLKK